MTTATPSVSPLLKDAVEGRALLMPWTVEQYHWAIKTGYLEEDTAYELLDGWIVRKDRAAAGGDPMVVGDRHRISVIRLADLAPQFKPHDCFLQSQQPIALPPLHEPEPDAAIVRGVLDNYRDGPPGAKDVLCVVEVSDASLRRDRTVKLKAYASAGIPLYVIVNLVDDRVELYTIDEAGGYATPRFLPAKDTLSIPTAVAGVTVDVAVSRLLA
jgi:Uma2 family endonuclease